MAASNPPSLPSLQSTDSFWHSQPSPLLTGHRSTRDLPKRADIVIIGSGITGASIAHHLLDPGSLSAADADSDDKLDVVLLEAREVCWGATGRNGGHCFPVAWEFPHDPNIGQFEMKNFHAIHELIRRFDIPCEFVVQPGVRGLYTDQHLTAVIEAHAQLTQTAPDLAAHLHIVNDPSKLAELRLPSAKGAIITDTAARLWPYQYVATIFERLLLLTRLRGSRTFNLQALTPVRSIIRSSTSDWQISTPRGSMLARKVILATNAYTAALLPAFESLIVPCRGQMSALQPPADVAGENRLKASYGFLGAGLDDYLVQRTNEAGGQLMFGGGRQMGGPSLHTTDDSVLDQDVARYLRSRLVTALGAGADGKGVGERELVAEYEWTGIMGFSRDDLPWVGEVPWSLLASKSSAGADRSGSSGVFLAAGYTGHGMPNAWLCGRTVASLAEGGLTVEEVRGQTGLPKAYVITDERIDRAQMLESVAARDWAEMARAEVV